MKVPLRLLRTIFLVVFMYQQQSDAFNNPLLRVDIQRASITTRTASSALYVYRQQNSPSDRVGGGNKGDGGSGCTEVGFLFTHDDILWKIRPMPDTPRLQRWRWRAAANLVRLECFLLRRDPPTVLCPSGGKALLEAHCEDLETKRWKKIGSFGITTDSGPPIPPIQETVSDIYGINPSIFVRTAAVIYMVVDEEYRKMNVGTLALEVISLIHAFQGCDFTVLVADDRGSGKLIEWYKGRGYTLAPKLQNVFGSPDGKFGATMIAPTKLELPSAACRIRWW